MPVLSLRSIDDRSEIAQSFLITSHSMNSYKGTVFQLVYRARLKGGPRLRECCRQGQAEVLSNSRNEIHQTWGPTYSKSLAQQQFRVYVPEQGHMFYSCTP